MGEVWRGESPLRLPLLQDVIFVMAVLGFVTKGDSDNYTPNPMTQHLVTYHSALCGLLQGAIDGMTGPALLTRQLQATNFQYPFKERQTPFQYAYESMGQTELAKSDLKWVIKAEPSFPDLAKMCGYELASKLSSGKGEYTLVDIGEGRGRRLQEVLKSFPGLKPKSLVLQEYSVYDVTPEVKEQLTVMPWNFKTSPQPIENASIYFSWIFHNLLDEAANDLLKKLTSSMGEHSRLLILESVKNLNAANLHAIMILILGGRERSSGEWKALAAKCGLEVSFEAYPPFEEGDDRDEEGHV